MQDFKYPLATATWDEAEIAAMYRVIESGNFTMGQNVGEFESLFAAHFGSRYAVMSNSGSSANLLALAAIRYSSYRPHENRDEVIVPAVSWSTTYYPITQMGFKLKFVDIDIETLNAPIDKIKAAVNGKTAGILVVNLLGNPSELSDIRKLCDELGLFMVEDNCESLGAEVDGRATGTFGDIGTFSTFFSHHISTMEGGVSLTNNLELFQIMISLRAHGWTRELPDENLVFNKSGDDFNDLFRFVLPGYNLRPIELEGAVGIEQIKKIPGIVSGRQENALEFARLMKNFPEIKIQKEIGKSSWFGFSLLLTGKLVGKRGSLISMLKERGIAYRPVVAGNFTRNPVLRHLPHVEFKAFEAADSVHFEGLFLGNHHYPMEEEFALLHSTLTDFYKL